MYNNYVTTKLSLNSLFSLMAAAKEPPQIGA